MKNKLKSILALHGDTQGNLAKYLSLSENRLSAKFNGYRGADFTRTEIAKMKKKYGLNAEQIDSIFFDLEVSE